MENYKKEQTGLCLRNTRGQRFMSILAVLGGILSASFNKNQRHISLVPVHYKLGLGTISKGFFRACCSFCSLSIY